MPTESSSGTAFKDQIDVALVARLCDAFTAVWSDFPADRFRGLATTGLDELELKARIAQIAGALLECLPASFADAVGVVEGVLELPSVDGRPGGLSGWDCWPLPEWVALAGRDDPGRALELLARVTRYSSGEFAIRAFIDDDPPAVLARLSDWVDRDDEHVRRLVSEGTRPKLPWAPKLEVATSDPGYAVALLDRLVADESEYVRRSVSNHLNDLCRVDPALAIEVARRWSHDADSAELEGDSAGAARRRWVVRRGIRTFVKAGDPEAMRLLGHDPDVALVAELSVDRRVVAIGEHAEWTLRLRSLGPEVHTLVIDYAIRFVRANGTTGRKVFKWATVDLDAGEQIERVRRHRIAPITTRSYYSGEHLVEVQVNGVVVASGTFTLIV